MAIFRMKLAGREKPLLVKAAGIKEARDRVITGCDALNAEEVEAAFTNREPVWREGEPFPVEPAADAPGEKPSGGETE